MPRRVLSQVALAVSAAATVVVTAQFVQPVFAGRAPGLRQLVAASPWRESAAARAPWREESAALAALTGEKLGDATDDAARLESERQAFKADLLRTGKIAEPRADSLATYAVREAHERRVPAPLVFGVMMTENAQLNSGARSSVGAVGLMQVYPAAWRNLRARFGSDLSDDRVNLRYGVYILSHLIHRSTDDDADDTREVAQGLRKGLLRYNGCVSGTNTPRCHSYPDVVQRRVERLALSQCGGRSFEACVAEPMRRMLLADAGAAGDD